MRALLHDPPGRHDDDPARGDGLGQPVGDHQRRTAGQDRDDGGLQAPGTLAARLGRRLVQHRDRRVGQHQPSQGELLCLNRSEAGAGSRTPARLFSAGTGLSFSRRRTRARLRAGLEHMAVNRPLTAVAHHVGYSSASSFVAAFRQGTGHTPGAYFS